LHLVIVAATCATGGSSHGAIDIFNIEFVRHSDSVDVRVYKVLVNCDSDCDRRQVSTIVNRSVPTTNAHS
jgi:hypothetical protein